MSADQQGSLLLKRQLAGMWSPFFLVKTTVLFVRCLCQCNANSMASFSFTRTHQASYGRLFCWSYRRWESFEMGIDGGWTPGHFLVSFSQKCLCCRDIQWPSLIIVHACTSLIFVSSWILSFCLLSAVAREACSRRTCISLKNIHKDRRKWDLYPSSGIQMVSTWWNWYDFLNACTFPQHVVLALCFVS